MSIIQINIEITTLKNEKVYSYIKLTTYCHADNVKIYIYLMLPIVTSACVVTETEQ